MWKSSSDHFLWYPKLDTSQFYQIDGQDCPFIENIQNNVVLGLEHTEIPKIPQDRCYLKIPQTRIH